MSLLYPVNVDQCYRLSPHFSPGTQNILQREGVLDPCDVRHIQVPIVCTVPHNHHHFILICIDNLVLLQRQTTFISSSVQESQGPPVPVIGGPFYLLRVPNENYIHYIHYIHYPTSIQSVETVQIMHKELVI